jgi:hypothetical protein
MKRITTHLLLVAGLVPTALCWMELLCRIGLYKRYGSEPFLNHVADGYFGMMYSAAAGAAAALILGLAFSIRAKSIPRITAYSVAAVIPLAHMAVLFFMNQQDMLVTYSEFAKNMGP